MDLTTLIGVLVGTFLIVQGIGLDKLGNFYDIKRLEERWPPPRQATLYLF